MATRSDLSVARSRADLEEEEGSNLFQRAMVGGFGEDALISKAVESSRPDFAKEVAREEAQEAVLVQQAQDKAAEPIEKELDRKVEETATSIMAGSRREMWEQIPGFPSGYFDNNPNNQTQTLERLNAELLKVLKDPSDLNAIELALKQEKEAEAENRVKMSKALRDLKNRREGLDLTPLAGLISDPNRAKILATVNRPDFSAEDKRKAIAAFEEKLRNRNDAFRRSRQKLTVGLAKERKQQQADIIRGAIAQENTRLQKLAQGDWRKQQRADREIKAQNAHVSKKSAEVVKSMKEQIEDINNLRESLENVQLFLGDENQNSLAAGLFRFQLVRQAQPGGVITDADLKAVGANPLLINQIEALWEKYFRSGKPFTDKRDLPQIIDLLKATMHGKLRTIRKVAKEGAVATNASYRSTLTGENNIWPDSFFLDPENGIIAPERYIPADLERAVNSLKVESEISSGKVRQDAPVSNEIDELNKEIKEIDQQMRQLQIPGGK